MTDAAHVTQSPSSPGEIVHAARIPGSFSLVLPAYNEEGNIEYVVRQALDVLPQVVDEFEIIVVNDGSRDATPQIIDALAIEDPRVKPVHQANAGYGGAVKAGFKASIGDYVMFMDADRQFDIKDIHRLTPFVPNYDVVAGFRQERSDPLIRRINAEVFNLAVRILFGVHLRDLDCAFKIFRGDMLRSLDLTTSGALINAEMQAKLRRSGATIEQVGVGHYPRIAGQATGGDPKVILRAMRDILRLWRRMHRYQPPASTRRSERPYFVLGDVLIGAGILVAGIVAFKILRWLKR